MNLQSFRASLLRYASTNPKAERYLESLKALQDQVEKHQALGVDKSLNLWEAWRKFWIVGPQWSTYILENLEIPAKKAKSVEIAARVFNVQTNPIKGPRGGIIPWYEKNKKHFQALADAITWKPRQQGQGISSFGGFTIHDTLGLDPKALKRSHDILKLALSRLPPYLKKHAHGELYLVGQISRKNWAAWYEINKDVIYLRPNMRNVSIEDSASHLIHEIGHRFWKKELSQSIKTAWARYHSELAHKNDDKPSIPPEGTVLPSWFLLNGKNVRVGPRVPDGILFYDAKTGKEVGTVGFLQVFKMIRGIYTTSAFPTIYAASDPEEHFCDALAMKAMGTLPKDHVENFERVTGLH